MGTWCINSEKIIGKNYFRISDKICIRGQYLAMPITINTNISDVSSLVWQFQNAQFQTKRTAEDC